MKGISWLNDLKIRGSYGTLGSQNNLTASNAFSLYANALAGSYYDITGSSNTLRQGFYQSTIGNPFTGWEEDVILMFFSPHFFPLLLVFLLILLDLLPFSSRCCP